MSEMFLKHLCDLNSINNENTANKIMIFCELKKNDNEEICINEVKKYGKIVKKIINF